MSTVDNIQQIGITDGGGKRTNDSDQFATKGLAPIEMPSHQVQEISRRGMERTRVRGRVVGTDGLPLVGCRIELYRRMEESDSLAPYHFRDLASERISDTEQTITKQDTDEVSDMYAALGIKLGPEMQRYAQLLAALQKQQLIESLCTDENGSFEIATLTLGGIHDFVVKWRSQRDIWTDLLPNEVVKDIVNLTPGETCDIGNIIMSGTCQPLPRSSIIISVYDEHGSPVSDSIKLVFINAPLVFQEDIYVYPNPRYVKNQIIIDPAPIGEYELAILSESFAPERLGKVIVPLTEVPLNTGKTMLSVFMKKGIDLYGMIRNTRGFGVAKAKIIAAFGGGERVTESDESGRFHLTNIGTNTSYQISVEKDGYVTYSDNLPGDRFPNHSTITLDIILYEISR